MFKWAFLLIHRRYTRLMDAECKRRTKMKPMTREIVASLHLIHYYENMANAFGYLAEDTY